jgi:hypothetical protein
MMMMKIITYYGGLVSRRFGEPVYFFMAYYTEPDSRLTSIITDQLSKTV